MRILFAWTGVTSYMADSWRALAAREGVSLEVVVENVSSGSVHDAGEVFRGLDFTVVEKDALAPGLEKPDILFAVGWRSPMVRNLVTRRGWESVPKVCCFDMPWRRSLRCYAAKFVLGRFLRNFSAAYVPGAAAEKYARHLGFRNVQRGLFAIDLKKFSSRSDSSPREGFVYVGRFSPEKRVDLIEKAYGRYRLLGGKASVDYFGQGGTFVSASKMPSLYAAKKTLILASSFDPWPLVAVEATAAGCGVIMSDRCGNRFELPSARVVPYGDVDALAEAMFEAESSFPPAPCGLAEYDCLAWSARTETLARSLACERGAR